MIIVIIRGTGNDMRDRAGKRAGIRARKSVTGVPVAYFQLVGAAG